jgi:hypothetical protein
MNRLENQHPAPFQTNRPLKNGVMAKRLPPETKPALPQHLIRATTTIPFKHRLQKAKHMPFADKKTKNLPKHHRFSVLLLPKDQNGR